MSLETDDDDNNERDILYELFIYSEWVQEPELVTKFGYGDDSVVGRSRGLVGWFTPTSSICPPILWHRSSLSPWQLCLSSDHRLCAILKTNETVEVRSSGKENVAFGSVVATCHLSPENESEFRCMSWSPDSSLLAVGSPSGRVEVFDLGGGLQYCLENDNPLASLEAAAGGHALVDILWTRTENTRRTQWSYELVLVSYNGQVRSYLVNSESYSPSFTFTIPLWNGSSIGAVVYQPEYSLILIGEGSRRRMDNANADDPSLVADEAGLTAWKLLSEEPHLQKLATIYQDTNRGGIIGSMWSIFRSGCEDAVVCLAISPSGKQLVCLHSSNTVSLWSLPGLIVTKVWRSFELPAFEQTNPYLPESECQLHQKIRGFWDVIAVRWWSEQAIVVVRRAGSICVMSLGSGRNLLGENPEWFGLAPRLAAMDTQGFLTLECEWQMGLSKARANSSFIGSELENSFKDDGLIEASDEGSSEGQPSPSWLRRLLTFTLLRKTLEYVADMDFGEDAKPRRIVKIYRLLGVKATTPPELFAVKIENGEYDEALSLANRYDLDPDPVFQRQWRRSVPCKANIDAFLHRVSNRNWVLNECLTQIPNDAVSCRELLLYGIRITDVFSVAAIRREDVPENDATAKEAFRKKILREDLQSNHLSQEQKWLLECRRKFLLFLEALKLYESFSATFSSTEFGWFREQSPLSSAVHYAREGKPEAIFELFTQHAEHLEHHWLPLLMQFPETLHPDVYSKLLPYSSSKPPYSIRRWKSGTHLSRPEVDCSESLVPNPFAEEWATMERDFYEEEPNTVEWRCSPGKHPTCEMACQWFMSRARQIEEFTMLTENALSLIALARQKVHLKDEVDRQMRKLHDDLNTVKMMTFDCGMDFISLRDVEGKSITEQLRLIMMNATEMNYVSCFREWLLPFIELRRTSHPGSTVPLLKDHLSEQATHNFHRILRVWPMLISADQSIAVITNQPGEQIELAMACVEASREYDQLQLCRQLLSSLPSRPSVERCSTELSSLYDQLDSLLARVDAAQFLNNHGIELNLIELSEIGQNAEEIENVLKRMFHRLTKKSPRIGKKGWIHLAEYIYGPLKRVMPSLDIDQCFETMCFTLIGSMNRENINIASGLLQLKPSSPTNDHDEGSPQFPYKLSMATSQQLILRSAKDYINSATIHSDHCISLAKVCLSFLEAIGSNLDENIAIEARKEHDLIKALPLLNKFGVDMLPAQVRLHDKMMLIRKAVIANKTNYSNIDKINQLAKYLGIYEEEGPSIEGEILSMVAEVALREGDPEIALNLCKRIVHGGHVTGWKACAKVASCEDLRKYEERLSLIDFCVVNAPSECLKKLIDHRNNIQLQRYYDSLENKFGKEQNTRQELSLSSLPSDAVDTAKQLVNKVLPMVTQTVKGAVRVVGPLHCPKESSSQELNPQTNDDNDIERTTLMKLSVPAFYSGIWTEEALQSRLSGHFTSFDEGFIEDSIIPSSSSNHPQLATVMHFSAVADEVNGTKSIMSMNDDMLLTLAGEYLTDDVLLALGHLLQMRDFRRAEDHFLQQLPYTRQCLRLGSYTFALAVIQRENSDGHIEGDAYVRLQRDELVKRVQELEVHSDEAEELKALVAKFCQLETDLCQAELVQQKSGGSVDISRFGTDEEYKRTSILGMALCKDLEPLRVALNLARHYGISSFEVCARHVEYLFESKVHPVEIEARLQEEGIHNHLMEDPIALRQSLRQKIYPILRGTNYDHLKIYYRLLLACNQRESAKKRIDAYIMLLDLIDEKLDGVDFKRLISDNIEEQRASLLEIIDDSNIDEVVKLCSRFKALLQINRSTVLQLYLKNEFVAAGDQPQSELKNLFKKHLKHIRYLTPNDVLDFIMGVCFDPFVAAKNLDRSYRLEILKSFLAFTKSMAKKSAEAAMTGSGGGGGGSSSSSSSSSPGAWEDLQTRLMGFLQHLQKIEDGFVGELLDVEENPRLDGYVEKFEMTAGEKDKLEDLLTDCALSECDPLLLEYLLSICPASSINCTPADIFLKAIRLAMNRMVKEASVTSAGESHLGGSPPEPVSSQEYIPVAFQTRKPISVMRRLLKTGAKLTNDKGSFDRSVVELVRPFCLDKDVALSSRLEVLRVLKECSCMVRPEDETLRLHLETLALLQERWPEIQVASEETETAEGRQIVFQRLVDASEIPSQFDTLASLLESWPAFDASAPSPWLGLLLKMASSKQVSGSEYLRLMSTAQKYRSFTKDEIYALHEAWMPLLTRPEQALFQLSSNESDLHEEAVDIVKHLHPTEITEAILDRLLELQLVTRFVSDNHYGHLLDRLLQREDFQAISEGTMSALSSSGMNAEAASLAVLIGGLPVGLQSFTAALSYFNWKHSDHS